MINCSRPERGVFFIYTVDIIPRSALVVFSLLRAINYHYNKRPVIVDNIMIKTIHGGILLIVIIQPKFQRLVIDIYFIIDYSTVKIERASD